MPVAGSRYGPALALVFLLGAPWAATAGRAAPARPVARVVPVTDTAGLRAAIQGATAGDEIVLAPGRYDVTGNLRCQAAGTAEAPIVVRSAEPGRTLIRFDALEGFHVLGPHWHFEDLTIEGVCAADSDCEHAFHIVGGADFTVVRRNRVQGFNAHIKANGSPGTGVTPFPDDVLIEGNEFFNARARNTANPVTPIDVVGGRRWVVRANYIHDHQKAQGDHISYAAFLKGNSRDGIFERNLVACEVLHTGGIRLGLSFGGGGSGPDRICEDGTCSPEHQNGLMRNNLIVNCPADVGIYLNEAAGTRILHNTLYNTTGIDVRFAASTAELVGNVLMGRIRERDGGRATAMDNLTQRSAQDFARWFVDPAGRDFSLEDGTDIVDKGQPLTGLTDDYCGGPRDQRPDLGAIEYASAQPCDTTRPPLGPGPTPSPVPSPTTTPAIPTQPPPTASATPTTPGPTPSVTPSPRASDPVPPASHLWMPWSGRQR